MAIQVLHKSERLGGGRAPCCTIDFYSIDNGETWMNRKEFHEWHNNLIEVKPVWMTKIFKQ